MRNAALVLRGTLLRAAPGVGEGSPQQLRKAATAAAKSRVRVSVLRQVADAFGLTARGRPWHCDAWHCDAALDWVELSFKDQQLSRGDIWQFRRHLIDREPTVHVGKRSRSASFVLLIQVSTEMGEFDTVRARPNFAWSFVRAHGSPCAVHLTCALVLSPPSFCTAQDGEIFTRR